MSCVRLYLTWSLAMVRLANEMRCSRLILKPKWLGYWAGSEADRTRGTPSGTHCREWERISSYVQCLKYSNALIDVLSASYSIPDASGSSCNHTQTCSWERGWGWALLFAHAQRVHVHRFHKYALQLWYGHSGHPIMISDTDYRHSL